MKKKKIYSGAFALALLVAATVGVQESKKNDVLLNDLALVNVEALANGEIDFPWLCRHTSRETCFKDYEIHVLGDRIW